MKTISLGVVALLLAGATVFAQDSATKNQPKKAKQECQGTCLKKNKTGKCTSQNACSDMNTCGATCSK